MKQPDYFAELYVAGRFAGAGWNVYFPRRDRGFDFIISRPTEGGIQLLRPVQVKGKYPTNDKTDKAVYGYIGALTELHLDMVLAIPYFTSELLATPCCVAYLPFGLVRNHSRGYRSEPATFKNGIPKPRREYKKFFDDMGLGLVERDDWPGLKIDSVL